MVPSETEIEARLAELRARREALDREIADHLLYLELGRRLRAGAAPDPAAPTAVAQAPARAAPPGPAADPAAPRPAGPGIDHRTGPGPERGPELGPGPGPGPLTGSSPAPGPAASSVPGPPRTAAPATPPAAQTAPPAAPSDTAGQPFAGSPPGPAWSERRSGAPVPAGASPAGPVPPAPAGPPPGAGLDASPAPWPTPGRDPWPAPSPASWPTPWPDARPGAAPPPAVPFEEDPAAARRYGRALVAAALAVLAEAGRPMHAGEILERLAARGFTVPGHDPVAALNTRLWKRSGPGGPLRRLGDAVYAPADLSPYGLP